MNLIVAQSGGPTSVINSSLAGVVDSGIDNDFEKIFVSMNGIEGIINENIKLVDTETFTRHMKLAISKQLTNHLRLLYLVYLLLVMLLTHITAKLLLQQAQVVKQR